MKINFDIPELIELATKVEYNPLLAAAVNRLLRARTSDEYQIAQRDVNTAVTGYTIDERYTYKDYGSGRNSFGLPIFQPLTLQSPDENEEDLFLSNALVSFNRQKNIVETVVQGRDSSIKEFINNGDYNITVNGFLFNKGFQYPIEKLIEFTSFMDKNTNIKIQHEVLNAVGIYEIVILSHDCPKTPQINIQTFSFTAKSDKPLPLKIADISQSSQLL